MTDLLFFFTVQETLSLFYSPAPCSFAEQNKSKPLSDKKIKGGWQKPTEFNEEGIVKKMPWCKKGKIYVFAFLYTEYLWKDKQKLMVLVVPGAGPGWLAVKG